MNLEKYSERVQGFIQSAQTYALGESHQQFAPEHILKVLIDDNEGMAAGLIQALRFARGPGLAINGTLARMTGEAGSEGWFDWMLWQEAHPEIIPDPSFIEFKREILLANVPENLRSGLVTQLQSWGK